jgi:hypothetical protein
MALIGNRSVIHKSPGRFLNGTSAAGAGIGVIRSAFNKHGMMRNAFEQYSAKAAIPYGHLSPSAWVMPKTAGGMSSRNVTLLQSNVTGLAVGGITTTGDSSFTISVADAQAYPLDDSPPVRTASAGFIISFADAAGQLISSGAGNASMQFTFANALLTASIGGTGSANFVLSTNNALLGAIANGSGAAAMQVTVANAQAYPLNDASPLRTASAGLSFSGTLLPYARGLMQGSTVSEGVLTTDSIAAAVWSALASEYTQPNTTGSKLNTASSGGVDLTALAEAILSDARFKRVLTTGNFLALKD